MSEWSNYTSNATDGTSDKDLLLPTTKERIADTLDMIIAYDNGVLWMEVVTQFDNFPDIEKPYGLFGSWARLLLEMQLWLITDMSRQPRDLDIFRHWEEDEPYEWSDDYVSGIYMPDDFAHWYGVTDLVEDYFKTRDFTINEIYYYEWMIYFTEECLDDLCSHIIRPTEYTYNENYENHEYRTVIKALRMLVERQQDFPESRIEFMNNDQLKDEYRNLFWIALNLDKAHSSGYEISEKLFRLFQAIWFLPGNLFDVHDAKLYIEDSWEVFDFEFKNIRDIDDINNDLLDMAEHYIESDLKLYSLDSLNSWESSKLKWWRI